MSPGNAETIRPRKRRFSTRAISDITKGRRLHHVIDLIHLSQTSTIVSSDEERNEHVLDYLKSLGNVTTKSAMRILPLAGLRTNEAAWKYVCDFYALPAFREKFFLDSEGPHVFALEIPTAFNHGSKPHAHEKHLDPRKELHCIALRMSHSARDKCMYIFVVAASLFASLCSFMGGQPTLSIVRVIEVVNRYLAGSWRSSLLQSQYLTSSDTDLLVKGWNLVSETLKLYLHELVLMKLPKVSRDIVPGKESLIRNLISEEDVAQRARSWCYGLVCEFFAWTFPILEKDKDTDLFVNGITDIAKRMASQLITDIGYDCDDEFSTNALRNTVFEISNGAPTMAEVHYEEITMSPILRTDVITCTIKWSCKDVSKRGRDPSSLFLSTTQSVRLRDPGLDSTHEKTSDGTYYGKQRQSHKQVSSTEMKTEELKPIEKRRRKSRWGVIRDDQQLELPRETSVLTPREAPMSSPVHLHLETLTPTPPSLCSTEPSKLAAKPVPNSLSNIDLRSNTAQKASALSMCRDSFFTELTSWQVYPGPKSTEGHFASANANWLKTWTERHKDAIKNDASDCKSMQEYSAHWKPLIIMELRGNLVSALQEKFPSARKKAAEVIEDFHGMTTFRIYIKEVSYSKTLTELTCESNDVNFMRTVACDLQGGTVCIGYVRKQGNNSHKSELLVIACRSLHWDEESYSFGGTGGRGQDIVDVVYLKLTINRNRFRNMRRETGDESS